MTCSGHRLITLTLNPALDVATAVEEIAPFRKLRCAAERRDPGGGGINVARMARRLGAAPVAVFPVGGPAGAMLEALLRDEGVETRAVAIAGATRESFSVIERRTGLEYRFVLPGPALSSVELNACRDAVLDLCTGEAVAVASGSLPPGVDDGFYAGLAAALKLRGAKLALDTAGAALRAALDEGVYLVKPNRRELSELAGRALDDMAAWRAAAETIVRGGGAEIVALTIADKGALLVTRDGAWHAAAPSIVPVSTVGAGDSFLGALMCALVSGRAPGEALRRAVAAGSSALLAPGTELGRPQDVTRLMEDVRLESLD